MLNFRLRLMKTSDEELFKRMSKLVGSDNYVEVANDQCHRCAHWKVGTLKCKAFPDGIPLGFLEGAYNHTAPYPGDNGVLFEPVATNK